MASAIKSLVGLAFTASLGLILLVFGCALPQFNSFWPFFNFIFYFCAPLPILIGRKASDAEETSPTKEWGYFFATGFIIAAFGLPIVQYRVGVIKAAACGLVTAGNVFFFLTIWGFLRTFNGEEDFDW